MKSNLNNQKALALKENLAAILDNLQDIDKAAAICGFIHDTKSCGDIKCCECPFNNMYSMKQMSEILREEK